MHFSYKNSGSCIGTFLLVQFIGVAPYLTGSGIDLS